MNTFTQPDLGYAQLWPLLVVFGAACAGVVVEAFVARAQRYVLQVSLAGAAVIVALVGTIVVAADLPRVGRSSHGLITSAGALVIDGPAIYLQALVLVCALGGVLLFAERRIGGGVTAFAGQAAALPGSSAERRAADLEHTEVFPLLLFAVGGMMLFPAANDLLLLFVALEVLSLPLYLLAGLARRRRLLSQEAALKYFLLGAFSSAFFLYGAALVYGATGAIRFADIERTAAKSSDHTLLVAGIALMAVGLLFKVGAVPFQAWTPDVYQGAPTPLVAFMAAGTKIAAFGALLRLFYVAFGAQLDEWRPLLWAVAIATMLVGAVVALVQTDVKRMLGYSAVAHSGFVLTGMIGLQGHAGHDSGVLSSTGAVLFYLTAYAAAVLGSFALAGLVRDAGGEATGFAAWTGLGRRSPLLGAVMTLFMLSLAGIPPTAGFIAKWTVIAAAADAEAWPVVIVAILASLIAIVSYVRMLLVLFFRDPGPTTATVGRGSLLTSGVITVCAVATVVLGVLPGPLLDLVVKTGSFIG
ncbi:NADH-quinone oxidoreductase subunit NuoN [Nocardioides sp. Kera G14]|uniref:NADH-quinone oxidoreductase subunit NuoN n=1 Tax=Nocardioides sp. Kera G14 TaxID=2884264 RepID=UPI001D10DC9A|nr:NADH-quinone oxidoreductase subunit NuoN [Nocardioides sp. Kera G14]UDY23913.1 NADH-quinone oxidoreductase subunit NuoN [Nocardioides sp. Kera G14]